MALTSAADHKREVILQCRRRSGATCLKICNSHYCSGDTVLSHPPTQLVTEPEPLPNHAHSPPGCSSEWQSHPGDRGQNRAGPHMPHRHVTRRDDVMLALALQQASPIRVGLPCMGFSSVALRHGASRCSSDNTARSDIYSASRPLQSVGLLLLGYEKILFPAG